MAPSPPILATPVPVPTPTPAALPVSVNISPSRRAVVVVPAVPAPIAPRALAVPTAAMLQNCPEYVAAMEHLARVHRALVRETQEKEGRLRAVVSLTEKTREDGERGDAAQLHQLEAQALQSEAEAERVSHQIGVARSQLVAARERRLHFLKDRERERSAAASLSARSTPYRDAATLPPATPQTPKMAASIPPLAPKIAKKAGGGGGVPPEDPLSPGAQKLEKGYNRLQELQKELEAAQRDLQDAAQGSPVPKAVSVSPSKAPPSPAEGGDLGGEAFPSEEEILQNLRQCLTRSD